MYVPISQISEAKVGGSSLTISTRHRRKMSGISALSVLLLSSGSGFICGEAYSKKGNIPKLIVGIGHGLLSANNLD